MNRGFRISRVPVGPRGRRIRVGAGHPRPLPLVGAGFPRPLPRSGSPGARRYRSDDPGGETPPLRGSATGTTLIEVLAGLVILGTLLVSVAIARGRFLRQWADADRRIAATHEADQLIEGWMSGPASSVPLYSQGYTDDAAHRPWRTSLVPSSGATTIGSVIVRLQIFENTDSRSPTCQVDFLLRDPRLRPALRRRS